MASVHGHEVLNMMIASGESYSTESLTTAIEQRFGADARFHTCSAENMSAAELVTFLQPGWPQHSSTRSMTLLFPDALSAMRSLKGIGATHLHEGRAREPLTRSKLQQLQLAWPKVQGQCPLTYHLFSGVITRD